MKFNQKSYSNHYSNPNPTVVFDDKKLIFAAAFCWGKKIDVKSYLDKIVNYYLSQKEDTDQTRPIPLKEELDFTENCLRTSLMSVNNQFYKLYNLDEYTTGLEIFIATQVGHAIYFVKTGQPHIILNRKKSNSLISTSSDFSSEFEIKNRNLAPLPKKLFGIYPDIEFEINKHHCKKNDEFLFIKRSQLNNVNKLTGSFDDISSKLISQNEELPFWLASLKLD